MQINEVYLPNTQHHYICGPLLTYNKLCALHSTPFLYTYSTPSITHSSQLSTVVRPSFHEQWNHLPDGNSATSDFWLYILFCLGFWSFIEHPQASVHAKNVPFCTTINRGSQISGADGAGTDRAGNITLQGESVKIKPYPTETETQETIC